MAINEKAQKAECESAQKTHQNKLKALDSFNTFLNCPFERERFSCQVV